MWIQERGDCFSDYEREGLGEETFWNYCDLAAGGGGTLFSVSYKVRGEEAKRRGDVSDKIPGEGVAKKVGRIRMQVGSSRA